MTFMQNDALQRQSSGGAWKRHPERVPMQAMGDLMSAVSGQCWKRLAGSEYLPPPSIRRMRTGLPASILRIGRLSPPLGASAPTSFQGNVLLLFFALMGRTKNYIVLMFDSTGSHGDNFIDNRLVALLVGCRTLETVGQLTGDREPDEFVAGDAANVQDATSQLVLDALHEVLLYGG